MAAGSRRPVQRAGELPAGRQGDVRRDRNLPGEIARRIERQADRLEEHHVRGDFRVADIVIDRREILERDIQLGRASRHRQVKGIDIDRVAHPGDLLAAGRDLQPGESVDRTFRRMRAGQPFWIEQREVPGLDRDHLMHTRTILRSISVCVDRQPDRAGKRSVLWIGNGRRGAPPGPDRGWRRKP